MLDRYNQNKKFLEKFTLGCKYVYNENQLDFVISEELEKEKKERCIQGYIALCVSGEIKFIGEAFAKDGGVYKAFNNFKNGGVGGPRGNRTWRRIKRKIIKCLCSDENVEGYFIECSKKENYKTIYRNQFQKDYPWKKIPWKSISKADKKDLLEEAKLERMDELEQIFQPSRNIKEKKRALENAGGKCALCHLMKGKYGYECITFERRSNVFGETNKNYLEVHHLIPVFISSKKPKLLFDDFSFDEIDVAENMVCLCSNCHNKIHYGKFDEIEIMLEALYDIKESDLKNAQLDIGEDNLIEIYKILTEHS